MDVHSILPVLQTLLAGGNLIVMFYALTKFVTKPHDTIEKRLTTIEIKIGEIERSLQLGNDEFRRQKETNEVIQTCMLALIDFELSYCSHTNYDEDITDLQDAKVILRKHLGKK